MSQEKCEHDFRLSHYENNPDGRGQYVSICRHCGKYSRTVFHVDTLDLAAATARDEGYEAGISEGKEVKRYLLEAILKEWPDEEKHEKGHHPYSSSDTHVDGWNEAREDCLAVVNRVLRN